MIAPAISFAQKLVCPALHARVIRPFSLVSAFVASIACSRTSLLGGDGTMLRKTFIAIAATAAIGAAVALAPAVASARAGGGGGHGGGGHGGGGHGGAMAGGHGMGGGHGFGGGFHGGMGGGVRGAMIGGGFRGAAIGGGLRSAGGFVGSRSFAVRSSVAPRFNRVAFARFNRFGHRRFAFARVPFGVGVGLYGGSCWSSRLTPWGWQRVWVCDSDYGYYGYY